MVRRWWRERDVTIRDFDLIMAFAALLVAGGLFHVVFLYAALVVAAVVLARVAVRYARRRHAWRTQPPPEFWADRLEP